MLKCHGCAISRQILYQAIFFHSVRVHMAVRAVAHMHNHGLSPQFSYVTETASHLTVTLQLLQIAFVHPFPACWYLQGTGRESTMSLVWAASRSDVGKKSFQQQEEKSYISALWSYSSSSTWAWPSSICRHYMYSYTPSPVYSPNQKLNVRLHFPL